METTDYCFSFFRKPIQNIEPIRAVGIVDVYPTRATHAVAMSAENEDTILSIRLYVPEITAGMYLPLRSSS